MPKRRLIGGDSICLVSAMLAIATAPSGCATHESVRAKVTLPVDGDFRMEQRCRVEVAELHRFFEQWFNAELSNTDGAAERFAGVLAPEFHIVSPAGMTLDRQQVIAAVRRGHGSSIGQSGANGIKIRIEKYAHLATLADAAIVSYEEWQTSNGKTKGRQSTAVFRRRKDTPNGVEWVHVHETWLPEP